MQVRTVLTLENVPAGVCPYCGGYVRYDLEDDRAECSKCRRDYTLFEYELMEIAEKENV